MRPLWRVSERDYGGRCGTVNSVRSLATPSTTRIREQRWSGLGDKWASECSASALNKARIQQGKGVVEEAPMPAAVVVVKEGEEEEEEVAGTCNAPAGRLLHLCRAAVQHLRRTTAVLLASKCGTSAAVKSECRLSVVKFRHFTTAVRAGESFVLHGVRN